MKAGDVINGYRILEDFRVVGAGLSKWTFAAKDGREYFIKEFLSPTFPDEHAPGSAQTKMRKRQRCAAFERHHRRINEALAEVSGVGGNLIVTLAFFRWGAKYYKVTEKVEVAGLSPADVTALPFQDQLVLLKTVAHSLRILHDRGIVHGDLKPSNVLIKRTELGYTTKLIDFDNAYLAGEPPPPGEIVGTMNYYSPELVGYIQETGTAAHQLTQKADIFALGLIYAEYLTGALPAFDAARYQYAGVAARAGEILRLPPTTLPTSRGGAGRPDAAGRPRGPTDHRRGPHRPDGDPHRRHHHRGPDRIPPQADPDRPEPAQGPGATDGDPGNAIPRRRAAARPAAHGQAPGTRQRPGHAMSTRWQCAVCEASNDGGDTCSVCGATVVKTTTRVPLRPQAASPQAPGPGAGRHQRPGP